MTATLKVLVPEATSNYIENPSFRYWTGGGWTAVGSSLYRVLYRALYGIASCAVITDGLAMQEGLYYRVTKLSGTSTPVTVSAYVRGAGRVHIRLSEGGNREWTSPAVALNDDRWVRLEVTGFSNGGDDLRLYVETDETAQQITFYVTACQMETKAYATTYCDGDRPGCRWNLMNSASVATRNAYTREGGRWVTIVEPCMANDDIYVTVMGGLGMPPLQLNTQSWALAPGSYMEGIKVLDRSVTIAFNVKNEDKRTVTSPNSKRLHFMRQQLIDIFKPDKTAGHEPFLFSYQEGDRPVYLRMRYEGGLDGNWDIRNQWINSFPVRFLVVDPFFYEDNASAQQLNFKETIRIYGVAGRVDGEWDNLADGLDAAAAEISKGVYGEILVVGSFLKDQNGTVTLNRITFWSGQNWVGIGVGANGEVGAIAVHANADIVIGGSFTSVGGVACTRVAKWNLLEAYLGIGNWAPMDAGMDDDVYYLKYAPNGDIYAGGMFHSPGMHIARWPNNGAAWEQIGTGNGVAGGTSGYVGSIAIRSDGKKVYFGGDFVKNNGSGTNDLNHIAIYDPSTNIISPLGSGFDDVVVSIALSPSGVLYAAGVFLHSGTTDLNRIARWNESAWIPMGDGITGKYVLAIDAASDEKVIAVGQFTKAGEVFVNSAALWQGSNWVNLDIDLSPGAAAEALELRTVKFFGDDIYIGGDIPEGFSSDVAAINYVTNEGTAFVYPVLYITGPGNLRWVENQTTRKRVYLDLTILQNEDLWIDFGTKKITGSRAGDRLDSIIQGSNFGDFFLIPGENKLAIFMTDEQVGGATPTSIYIYYRPTHWSADGTAKAEALV